jgi:polyisoprenoid-binding protein YceI
MPFRNYATCVFALALFVAACGGGSPTSPPPPQPPPPNNAAPVIVSISVQGRRASQPARMADLRETVDVTATVTDAETAVEQLTYQWTATAGTFGGTGRQVTWTAPDSAATPSSVTITLRVIETYGSSLSHQVTSTQTVALHDSSKEVGDMAVRFLTEFSKPQTNQDWRDVMRDFDLQGGTCEDAREIENERGDVERHYENFFMHDYSIGAPNVSIAFDQGCAVPGRGVKPGDACASVGVAWDSTGPDGRGSAVGTDYLSAAYSTSSARWFLCSSDFLPTTTFGHRFYSK